MEMYLVNGEKLVFNEGTAIKNSKDSGFEDVEKGYESLPVDLEDVKMKNIEDLKDNIIEFTDDIGKKVFEHLSSKEEDEDIDEIQVQFSGDDKFLNDEEIAVMITDKGVDFRTVDERVIDLKDMNFNTEDQVRFKEYMSKVEDEYLASEFE